MSSVVSAVRLALLALARSKLRSALTVLGILIGIAAVVVVVALGEGASGKIGGRIQSLGSNVVYVFDQPVARSGLRSALGSSAGLTDGDVEAIGRESKSTLAA